jgi:ribosome-associated translation inhibitor RaiA
MAVAALIGFSLLACHKALPADAVCSYEPLPPGADVPSGQGGIQTLASTDVYFSVRNGDGKQVASAHVNGIAALAPGDYQVVVNNSIHQTSVQAKSLTKCTSGTILVNGTTDEYFAVLDDTNRQLASVHVSSAVSLFPGTYKVRLNNTEAGANLQAGATLELKSGTINVDAGTDEYYAVLDVAARQLASSHVGRALGLFPGTYMVRINNSDAKVDVHSEEASNVATGTLVVHGSTDEYYAVTNNAGTQLASAHLEKPLAFIPGNYNVKVNNTTAPANVSAGTTNEIKTGAVLVRGTTDEYYAVIDTAGNQLASTHLGRAVSLMPGVYRAKLNNVTMPLKVSPGQVAEYQSGVLNVKADGSDHYAVLDASGSQLASKQVNQPVSLPAGNYSVKLNNETRPATVIGGQSMVLNW